jgi:hypothetical protein
MEWDTTRTEKGCRNQKSGNTTRKQDDTIARPWFNRLWP